MTNHNDFEILSSELLTLLDAEYDIIKAGNYKALNDTTVLKSKKTRRISKFSERN